MSTPLRLTEPYTLEERKMLCEIITREINKEYMDGTWGYMGDVMQFEDDYAFTPSNLTPPAFVTCMIPLEDMPLHINSEDTFVRGVSLWRLQIGK